MPTRRELLKMGLMMGAALLLPPAGAGAEGPRVGPQGMGGGGMGGGGTGGGGGGGMGGLTSPPPTPFTDDLPVPSPLVPEVRTDEKGEYDFYNLSVEVGQWQFIPKLATETWGYRARTEGVPLPNPLPKDPLRVPGPVIVAQRDRRVKVKFKNSLNLTPGAECAGDHVVVHLHGGHVPVEADGHMMDMIMPGMDKTYEYPNNQPGAMIWFHDHTMDRTCTHVIHGITGIYIIHDPAEDQLGLPSGAYDIPLVIQDRSFLADGSFDYTLTHHALMHGYHGDVALVNGAIQPKLSVQGRKYRFRLLNGSNGRFYELALSNGRSFVQIAGDGSLLPEPVTRKTIYLAPGERIEVVIDFAPAANTKVVLKNLLSSGRTGDIMRFDIGRRVSDGSRVPSTLCKIAGLAESEAVKARTFTLGMSVDGMFTINGEPFNHHVVNEVTTLDAVEIWEFVNPMGMAHPMHVHDILWQVLDRNGVTRPAHEAGWKDTWVVPPRGRTRVIGKFADYTCSPMVMDHKSSYMYHCHILEHEEHGMMGQFRVLQEGEELKLPEEPMPM